jgi:hypothetical protein
MNGLEPRTASHLLNSRSPQFELIQPLDGPSVHADWLARIHSFGADGDGAAAYYDTADALGFLVEAVEPPARMPAQDFTL